MRLRLTAHDFFSAVGTLVVLHGEAVIIISAPRTVQVALCGFYHRPPWFLQLCGRKRKR